MLLSSHILSEVEELCDRVSIIRAGRLVESGTLAELRHLTRIDDRLRARARTGGRDRRDRRRRTTSSWTTAACCSRSTASGSPRCCPNSARLGVQGLTVMPPSLEELFLRHYGDELALVGPEARA